MSVMFSGIVAALVTPLTTDGDIDLPVVPRLIEFLLEKGYLAWKRFDVPHQQQQGSG